MPVRKRRKRRIKEVRSLVLLFLCLLCFFAANASSLSRPLPLLERAQVQADALELLRGSLLSHEDSSGESSCRRVPTSRLHAKRQLDRKLRKRSQSIPRLS